MLRSSLSALVLCLTVTTALAQSKWPPAKPTTHNYARWEPNIAEFEKADKKSPPPKGAVLFVGSSTIVRWKTLQQDFPEVQVINRGFGGNQIKDSTHYAERMIFPYEPSMIVLRAGGNDINAGWPAEDVFADFKTFVAKMRTRLPTVPIVYIGLSPTVKREEQIAEGNKLNDLIAAYVKTEPNTHYIDTRETTVGKDGRPKADLFVADMLHFNPAGYKLLTEKVRPVVLKLAGKGE
jgi:lysophospholipase L1-like esterase